MTSRTAAQTTKAEADARLDEALAESFPASDPPAIARATPPAAPKAEAAGATAATAAAATAATCERKARDSRTLDEALDESFPASDPPSIVQPHGPDADADTDDCPMP